MGWDYHRSERLRVNGVSIAASPIRLGLVMLDRVELAGAETLFGETCTLCAEIGDRWGLAMSLDQAIDFALAD